MQLNGSNVQELRICVQSISLILTSYICWWWFDFKLEQIFATALAASKNKAPFKNGQNWFENNNFATKI